MAPPLSRNRIRQENLAFAGTGGVSQQNHCRRLCPAFRDEVTGHVELSRYANGAPAPVHVIDGLPGEWICTRDGRGQPVTVKSSVVAGFVRDGEFYTREQAAELEH